MKTKIHIIDWSTPSRVKFITSDLQHPAYIGTMSILTTSEFFLFCSLLAWNRAPRKRPILTFFMSYHIVMQGGALWSRKICHSLLGELFPEKKHLWWATNSVSQFNVKANNFKNGAIALRHPKATP
jgi:hypothetical protein